MNKIVEKAKEINKLQEYIPELEIGEICEINDVWDGRSGFPEGSYDYLLTHDGEDGQSNYPIWINYEFEIIEEKENPLDTIIKITNIDFI